MLANIAPVIRTITFVFGNRFAVCFNVNTVFLCALNRCSIFIFTDIFKLFHVAASVIV